MKVSYPVMQVRPYGLLLYERHEYDFPQYHYKSENGNLYDVETGEQKEINKNLYTGQITEYSRKRLKRAINLLVATAEEKEAINFKTGKKFKFKVNFITLTLPAPQKDVTDKQLKKEAFDPFIKRIKRKHNLNNYVWRAERQKNGNLHFHILTDTYIRYDNIRDNWNSCLRKWHFIDDFKEKFGHAKPNSTDVHSIQKIKNVAAYVVKYMSKESEEKDTIEGKIWDCSKPLKHKGNCELLFQKEQNEIWEAALSEKESKEIRGDKFTLLLLSSYALQKVLKGETAEVWHEYKNCIRTGIFPVPEEIQPEPTPPPPQPPPQPLKPDSIQLTIEGFASQT